MTKLKPPGLVLGIDSGSVFDRITNDSAVPLERDDCLILYTDGVTEALNANGDEFGPERMMQSVQATAMNFIKRRLSSTRQSKEDARSSAVESPGIDCTEVVAETEDGRHIFSMSHRWA